ncbi:hypothetical protein C8J57DRAFT_1730890, partial [Mycena rebaudengoi]
TGQTTQLPPNTQHDPTSLSIHAGFQGTAWWTGFPPGSDRIILHTHPYFAFDGAPNDSPIATSTDPLEAGGIWPRQACSLRGPSLNTSRSAFGVTLAGDFSSGHIIFWPFSGVKLGNVASIICTEDCQLTEVWGSIVFCCFLSPQKIEHACD